MSQTFSRTPSPGRILARELEARDWSQKDLANVLGRPEATVSEIINGKKQVTPETAKQLSEALGQSADFWLTLEQNYQRHLADKLDVDKDIKRRARLFELAPINELIKLKWLRSTKDLKDLEKQLLVLLGTDSLQAGSTLSANLRHSEDLGPEKSRIVVWLSKAAREAERQTVGDYDKRRFNDLLDDLLALTEQVENVGRIPEVLNAHGIYFVVLKHLSKTYVDGAAFEVREQPAIALTLRYDRIDNFWFTLLHELAHIYYEHGVRTDVTVGGHAEDKGEEERQADRQAVDWLFPDDQLETFIAGGRVTKARILDFAQETGRHPGIVVGCLQGRGTLSFSTHRDMLAKVKQYLS